MIGNRKQVALAGGLAVAVATSWTAAYRIGAHSGQSLAMGVSAGDAPATAPAAPVSVPLRPSRADPTRTATASTAGTEGPAPVFATAPASGEPDIPASPAVSPVTRLLSALDETTGRGLLDLRLNQAAQELALQEIPLAVDALAALPAGPRREAALLAVVGRWAELSPENAVDYAAAETVPTLRNRMIQAAFSGWALRDPAAALAYLEQNPDWAHQEIAGQAVFEAAGELPVGDALMFLEQVDHDRYGALTQRTVSRLLELDPVAVRKWAEGLAEGTLRETVLARSLTAWAAYDPMGAREWMMENYDDEALAAQLPRLASVWARHAPQEARDWFLGLPEAQRTARVGQEVFQSWLRVDSAGAREYLDSAHPRPELDPGFQQYAYTLQRRDPSRSMELAANIRDERMRAETQSRVARYWSQRDPKAVLDYLTASSIPADERKSLITYAQSRLNRQSERRR